MVWNSIKRVFSGFKRKSVATRPPKGCFPPNWGPDKIMHCISDIATDPTIEWQQITGRTGAKFASNGKPVRFRAVGIREGVKIRVILEPDGEGIITGYTLE